MNKIEHFISTCTSMRTEGSLSSLPSLSSSSLSSPSPLPPYPLPLLLLLILFLSSSSLSSPSPLPLPPGEDNANYIKWMDLKTGPPRRCECGHWFVLVPFEDQDKWFQNRKKWLDDVQQRWLDENNKKWLELKERSKAEHAKGIAA